MPDTHTYTFIQADAAGVGLLSLWNVLQFCRMLRLYVNVA